MSDAVAAAPVAPVSDAPAKSPKKKAAAPKKAASGAKKAKSAGNHPKYSEMVQQALSTLKERGGSSRQAILKYIVKNFQVGNDEAVVNQHLKVALKNGVKNDSLKQSKGTGATGSFRIGEKKTEKKVAPKKKAAAPKKAAAAKKPKPAKAKAATKANVRTSEAARSVNVMAAISAIWASPSKTK